MRKLGKNIDFEVKLEGEGAQSAKSAGYAFDREGKLIASAVLKGGKFSLPLPAEKASTARLLIGPVIPEVEGVTLDRLRRAGGYEPTWEFDPRQASYRLPVIPQRDWSRWLLCRCQVRGRVVRPVSINGVTHEMPVCNARVHICEVDQWRVLIPKLPDDIIFQLRDELFKLIELPFPPRPGPGSDPPPFKFDPRVIDPVPEKLAAMQPRPSDQPESLERLFAAPVSQRSMADLLASGHAPHPGHERLLSTQPLKFVESAGAERKLAMFSGGTALAMVSESPVILRRAIADSYEIFRPMLCRLDFLWQYLSCDEIGVITTDHNGRFERDIWYPCAGDQPDLYFWVEFRIGGVWTSVYQPGVACATHWDYPCGEEVTIRVNDPRVPWCDEPSPLAGKAIAILTVGNGVSVSQVQGLAAGTARGLTPGGAPFGGSLEPHVWFGEGLIPAGITHFKWSYRRLGASGAWTGLTRQVVRHYSFIDSGGDLSFLPYLLGPDPAPAIAAMSLYKVQPRDPPVGLWASMVDARENSASGFFLSHLLDGGNALTAAVKYEIRLELFRSDGSLVNLTAAGVAVKVPDPALTAPFGPITVTTVAAPEENLIRDGGGNIVAFRMVLHVDNNPCQASIPEVSVNGTAADPCGFVNFSPGDNALIRFRPTHPNLFGDFSFTIARGSAGVIESASGRVGATPVNGYARDAGTGVYSKLLATAILLGPCLIGGRAAFAENLYVSARATDGWSRLSYLDAAAVPKAFALQRV